MILYLPCYKYFHDICNAAKLFLNVFLRQFLVIQQYDMTVYQCILDFHLILFKDQTTFISQVYFQRQHTILVSTADEKVANITKSYKEHLSISKTKQNKSPCLSPWKLTPKMKWNEMKSWQHEFTNLFSYLHHRGSGSFAHGQIEVPCALPISDKERGGRKIKDRLLSFNLKMQTKRVSAKNLCT